jgi:hypothetical protein
MIWVGFGIVFGCSIHLLALCLSNICYGSIFFFWLFWLATLDFDMLAQIGFNLKEQTDT